MITNPRFGADPELFLSTPEGKFISSIDRVGGTKMHPRPIDDEGAAVQEDNVAVEFNITPSATKESFIRALNRPLDYLKDYAKEMGLTLAIVPSARFDKDQLEDPRALQFGCEPDYNAWTGKRNPRPRALGENWNLRTCGGHVHIGWENSQDEEALALIRACDLFIGIPSVKMDADNLRRILYGKAGAHRRKVYGVEYRAVSNFWIQSEELMGWCFEQAQRAVTFTNERGILDSEVADYIASAINEGDQKAADKLIERYSLTVI